MAVMTEGNGGPLTVALIALEGKRTDDLAAAERLRVTGVDTMREDHRKEIGLLEKDRLDARAETETARVNAQLAQQKADVGLAYARAELTANALAERVDVSAKTLAAQADSTATTLATQVDATAKGLAVRIEPLEAARYTQAGRSGLSAPLLMMMAGFGGGLLVFIIQLVLTTGPK